MTDSTVRTVVDALDTRYPRSWAEPWDRVGLVLGEFDHPVARVLCVVDCVPETVEQAVDLGADLIVAHHPLFLKPVSSIAPDTFKGRIVHRLIRAGVALYTAHTNADVANPGVSDALAARLGLTDLRPLAPAEGAAAGEGRGLGRIGVLPEPLTLAELTRLAAERLPATSAGVRSAGDPDRPIRTVAVCGGAGDSFLPDATRAGVDAYLCADLRHHPVSEHLAAGGPALLDVAHWASERPWLDDVAAWLREVFPVDVVVSDVDTDPWTVHANRDDLEIRP
ncbi:GTP cyclohydrolase 1 type 2 [Actinoplanes lobatus]|uniref:GTP cyclohydrolase 1 type 2 homolog n=1 Tax=Actinoplanes lobatus TaxID=113568 RepID=A0A7W7HEU0_9ACTN|nr:Nif3-like dinuclear metal center hexameric protein [Actinoplanes lobatus]MBB4749261.1 dinuclear metal center YbgI/SA1388 family protein [Actinoplanes lobatus]GGN80066.1 GTP cyclohydrolase 1 type 2 [Actinoplanes lobatus]GIE40201.1 GTP cyclohydrolase 1 type 2 [Actinoplanes lobatus]